MLTRSISLAVVQLLEALLVSLLVAKARHIPRELP